MRPKKGLALHTENKLIPRYYKNKKPFAEKSINFNLMLNCRFLPSYFLKQETKISKNFFFYYFHDLHPKIHILITFHEIIM